MSAFWDIILSFDYISISSLTTMSLHNFLVALYIAFNFIYSLVDLDSTSTLYGANTNHTPSLCEHFEQHFRVATPKILSF